VFRSTAPLATDFGAIKDIRGIDFVLFSMNLKVKTGEWIDFALLNTLSTVFVLALFLAESIIEAFWSIIWWKQIIFSYLSGVCVKVLFGLL